MPGDPRRRRILVIEDNPITRKLVRMTLAGDGFDVQEAENGAAALRLVANGLPDLILQDMILPDVNGFDLSRQIRSMPGGQRVIILAFSGHEPSVDQARAAGAVFDDYLLKPVDTARMLAAVRGRLDVPATSPPDLAGYRLLVADDDPMRLKLLRLAFERLGAVVTAVGSGEAALDSARSHMPDGILSDVLMPGIDGFGLAAAIHRDPALSGIPVVLITTAYRAPEDRDLALLMGAADLLVFDPDRIESLVAGAARKLREPVQHHAPPGDPDRLITEHRDRVSRQLETQLVRNDALARRLALAEAELGILGGLHQIGLGRNPGGIALQDLVHRALDSAGVSQGLVVLESPHGGPASVAAMVGLPGELTDAAAHLLQNALREAGPMDPPVARVLQDGAGAGHPVRELLQVFASPAVLACPFETGENQRGWFAMGSTKRDVDADWIGFGSALAGQIAQTIVFSGTLKELAQSRELFRQVTENIDEVIFMLNGSLTEMEYLSRAYESIWGRTVESVYADPMSWLTAVHPDDRDRVAAMMPVTAERPQEFEYRIVRPGGGVRWITARTFPVRDAEGRVVRVTGIAEDVTSRRGRATRHEVEVELTALLTEAPGLEAVADRILAIIGGRFGWKVGVLWRPHRQPGAPADRLVVAATWSEPAVAGAGAFFEASRAAGFAPGAGLPGRVALTRRAIRVPDLALDDGFLRGESAGGAGLRSAVAFPVSDGGECHGVIEFFDSVTGTADDTLLSSLESLGRVLSQFCIRRRTEEALARSEERLQRAQKLEAVGQLAGGMAHDFNNLLTPIIGYCELILERMQPEERWRPQIDLVLRAARRGAGLIRQLLAFSRRQEQLVVVMDLNVVALETTAMLKRTIGENIEVVLQLDPLLKAVAANSDQISQVLLNLAINARDAMPAGGRLTIATRQEILAEDRTDTRDVVPAGEYSVLAVTDTGTGMTPDVLEHVYEPFYTTKGPGKGTGLGLATSYGIIKQLGGVIDLESRVGIGTTFRIYLPTAPGAPAAAAPPPAGAPVRGGGRTILLVEDETLVRDLTALVLREAGYEVLEAAHGGEALEVAERHAGPIHLLLTDVIMPVMDGPELAARLTAVRPVPVLFSTGYAPGNGTVLPDGAQFLAKPFTPSQLLEHVRRAIERGSVPAPPVTA